MLPKNVYSRCIKKMVYNLHPLPLPIMTFSTEKALPKVINSTILTIKSMFGKGRRTWKEQFFTSAT